MSKLGLGINAQKKEPFTLVNFKKTGVKKIQVLNAPKLDINGVYSYLFVPAIGDVWIKYNGTVAIYSLLFTNNEWRIEDYQSRGNTDKLIQSTTEGTIIPAYNWKIDTLDGEYKDGASTSLAIYNLS